MRRLHIGSGVGRPFLQQQCGISTSPSPAIQKAPILQITVPYPSTKNTTTTTPIRYSSSSPPTPLLLGNVQTREALQSRLGRLHTSPANCGGILGLIAQPKFIANEKFGLLQQLASQSFSTSTIHRESQPNKQQTTTTTTTTTTQLAAPKSEHNLPEKKDAETTDIEKKQAEQDDLSLDFGKSEKASRAAQINLSARLKKDPGNISTYAGFADIWRLLMIARPEAKWLAGAFVMLLMSSAVSMSIPFSIGKMLDVATGTIPAQIFGMELQQFYMALGGLLCVGAAGNFGRIILLRVVGERIVARLRSHLFRNTYQQDMEFFDANKVGDLISRLSSDTIIVGKSITQNLSDGLRAIVSGGAGLCMMAWTSLYLTGVMSIMIPPIAIGAFFYGRTIRNLSRKIQKAIGSATKVAEERLSNVRTAQAFAGEIQEVSRYNKEVKKIFELGIQESKASAKFFSATGLAGNGTILMILILGSHQVTSGAISIGELSSFLLYTAYAGSSLFGLSSFYSELMKGVGAASRLFELQDRKAAQSNTKGSPVKSARGVIKFQDVTFSYPTRPAVTIFDGLNFDIPPGTNIAIVGPSGGGKSTISHLLLRFYSPRAGKITINGVDIQSMNVKSLRRRIGIVSQEPVLFSGTIAENIAYARPNASRSDITKAARKANCQFIADFPEGLDTPVGARGTQLSGGQRQRIAIARAILKDPDVLILDEATSALDAESETLVNEALGKLMQGSATTISIAHRLSTIQRSDHIVVLGPEGKVAEQGTFKELSSRDGAFTRLMESQLGLSGPILQKEKPLPQDFPSFSEKEMEEIELSHDQEQFDDYVEVRDDAEKEKNSNASRS